MNCPIPTFSEILQRQVPCTNPAGVLTAAPSHTPDGGMEIQLVSACITHACKIAAWKLAQDTVAIQRAAAKQRRIVTL